MKKKILDLYAKLSKRERSVFFGTVLVLTALFADRLVVEPIHTSLVRLDTKIRDEETAVKKSLHVLLQKDRITAEGKELAPYSVEARNPEEEMTGLLKEIEGIADRSTVSLLYVKPAASKEAEGTKKYFATLECESEMQQIASFFHSLESSPKLLKIERYEIQPKNKDSSIARCAMTVSKTVLV